MITILIVDNEEKFCKVMQAALRLEGLTADYCTSGEAALEWLASHPPVDVVITDLRMEPMDGLQLLEAIKQHYPQIEVVLMTAYATQQTAVTALKKGAYDYLIKPFDMDEMIIRVRRILEQKALQKPPRQTSPAEDGPIPGIIGKSQAMQRVFQLIRKAAATDVTVLLRGESGTGKELVAHAIYQLSPRAGGPFITVNCAALPENLLESELFGYEKGAFTGATRRHIGKFEAAHGGTIFLDEIGDLSPGTQAKLLRVLQNREIYRLGGNARIEVDVRIIAATHKPLEEMVARGEFREDLYYRLNVFPIEIPPLRERKEDIPELVHHFLNRYPVQHISRDALALLMDYDWPGNVRELQNAIERAAIIAETRIEPAHLSPYIRMKTQGATPFELPEEGIVLDELEKTLILQALEKSGGNKTRAARLLGITRRRLYSMMERFGIEG